MAELALSVRQVHPNLIANWKTHAREQVLAFFRLLRNLLPQARVTRRPLERPHCLAVVEHQPHGARLELLVKLPAWSPGLRRLEHVDRIRLSACPRNRIKPRRHRAFPEVDPDFRQVVKVESRSDRRNLECHARDGATRLS